MKRSRNRLVATDTEQETPTSRGGSDESDESDGQDESETSTPVEWSDLSRRTAGPVGTAERFDGPSTVDDNAPAGADNDLLLATVLDTISKPTLLVDRAGEISHLNCAAREAFDTTEAEARGTEPHQLHGGQRLAQQVLDSGEEIVDHHETATIAGERYLISRTVTPLSDEGHVVAAMETVSVETVETTDQQSVDKTTDQPLDTETADR